MVIKYTLQIVIQCFGCLYTHFFLSINKSEYSFLQFLVLPVKDFSLGNVMKPLLAAEHNVMLRASYCRLLESTVCREAGWCCWHISSVVCKWRNEFFLNRQWDLAMPTDRL